MGLGFVFLGGGFVRVCPVVLALASRRTTQIYRNVLCRMIFVIGHKPDGATFEISPQRTQMAQRFQCYALRSLRPLRWIGAAHLSLFKY